MADEQPEPCPTPLTAGHPPCQDDSEMAEWYMRCPGCNGDGTRTLTEEWYQQMRRR